MALKLNELSKLMEIPVIFALLEETLCSKHTGIFLSRVAVQYFWCSDLFNFVLKAETPNIFQTCTFASNSQEQEEKLVIVEERFRAISLSLFHIVLKTKDLYPHELQLSVLG